MKTIFIFNDSRPSDYFQSIAALGEDGQLIDSIQFDGWTLPHVGFAMGVEHVLREDDLTVAVPVRMTRAAMLRRYDAAYSAGNWIPMWLDSPQTNEAWRRALHLMRERLSQPVPPASQFSDRGLTGILGAIFNSADVTPHTTH
ncbi:hypothetical protein [Paraburkholderia aromaticivorans]|uniref:hypothetical protein n=1 Tax=Paraburkholderia aromaticivorans TaxID=2026199 RepID=UPI001456171E|nr:hypothetical protein [Paraburkholderia aromaticivorans]